MVLFAVREARTPSREITAKEPTLVWNVGAYRAPPRLVHLQVLRVTSARRAGSQNRTANPMRGNGSAQAQSCEAGLCVSGRPLGQIFRPPTERGNRQDQ